jgi:tetratricopeptide (TPR) repeat protein
VDEMQAAVRLDPFSLVINARLATMLYFARRYDEALSQALHTLDLDSTFFSAREEYALALLALGRCREVLAFIENDPAALAISFRLLRGVAQARCGNKEAAIADLGRLRAETATGRYVPRYAFAVIHAALGNKEQALTELELALEEPAWELFTLPVKPDFDGYRSDPRFARLLTRIGLRASGTPR